MENSAPLPSEGKCSGRMLFTSTHKMLLRQSNIFDLPIKLNPTSKLDGESLFQANMPMRAHSGANHDFLKWPSG